MLFTLDELMRIKVMAFQAKAEPLHTAVNECLMELSSNFEDSAQSILCNYAIKCGLDSASEMNRLLSDLITSKAVALDTKDTYRLG